jgi:predicted Na+-dependent transporter
MTVGQIFGVVCALVAVVFVSINALYMLFSPSAWYRLPEWMQFSGSLRLKREKYSAGLGALQIRILGAIFLAVIFWLISRFVR